MNTLTFHNTQLNIINQNNQIWLTSAELAKALNYADRRSISKIYNQYSDEFTPCMTGVIESVTSGNYRTKYRIFSLRGAHLIAMFARTPTAKDFRKWVLDILDKEVNNPVIKKIEEPYCRYEIEITIKDNVFNKAINFNSKATSANAMITGFAKTLGFEITSMSLVDEPFSTLLNVN